MGKSMEKKLVRRRLANAWLSTIISISLVLLLVGLAALLLMNAVTPLIDRFCKPRIFGAGGAKS